MATDLTTTENELSKWDDKFDRIVKWFADKRDDDDPKKPRLPAPLQKQYERWTWTYNMLVMPKHRYKRDSDIILFITKQYPDLTERTARTILHDTRRFFAVLDQPNRAWEKAMLVHSMKDTLRRAKLKNDIKGANAAEKNLMAILGADQPDEMVENKTIINVINFNPTALGAVGMSSEQLDELIMKMLAKDKKKAEQPFDDFTDVTEK